MALLSLFPFCGCSSVRLKTWEITAEQVTFLPTSLTTGRSLWPWDWAWDNYGNLLKVLQE